MQLVVAKDAEDLSGVTFAEEVPEGSIGMRLALTEIQWQQIRQLASTEEGKQLLVEVARAGMRLESRRGMTRMARMFRPKR